MKAPTLSEWLADRLYKRFGIPGVFALAAIPVLLYGAFQVWTNWDTVRAWPGIPTLISRWNTQPIPQADPARYSIVVADLDGDVDEEYSNLIITRLREFAGIQVLPLHRTISVQGGSDADAQEAAGHREAVQYLSKTHASILIWGSLLRLGNEAQPQLRFSTHSASSTRARQFGIETPLRVSTMLWERVATLLYLQIEGEYANIQVRSSKGQVGRDELLAFINRTGFLLSAADPKFGWDPKTMARTQTILGDAFRLHGAQTNDRGSIERALLQYRLAAIAYSAEKDPAEWARLQNKRGGAQMDLADRTSDPADLNAAIRTYRDTLALPSGDRAEREVWLTRASLGMALIRLSEITRDPRLVEEAIGESRAALDEPRPWYSGVADLGYIRAGLGRALTIAGEHDAQPARLRDAIDVLVQASSDSPPALAPRVYAATQNHLGAALLELGDRESDRDLLARAVAAYENAIKYSDRNPDGLDQALATEGRCLARVRIGALERNSALIRECLTDLQEVVAIRARAGASLQKAHGLLNLGTAYSSLGRLERSPERLRQAISVETEALQELKRAGVAEQEAIAENNIGAALLELGRLEHNPALVQESVAALQSAMKKRCQSPSSSDCANARAVIVRARKASLHLSTARDLQ
jgi:tetratricopeptide (TPR) repeat protein